MPKSVAGIGAGPSGLAQLRAFQSAAKAGADIPEIVCFEKQDNWGGLWNYTWRTVLDEYGEPVHCSMYSNLWSNGPKEGLEFADYSLEEHIGKQIASYPPRAVLFDYIQGRVEKADVRKWIRFRTPVRYVEWDADTAKFKVSSHDLVNDKTTTEEFDNVVCCSGHFSTTNVPQFDGLYRFNGRVLHYQDFRDAVEFKDKLGCQGEVFDVREHLHGPEAVEDHALARVTWRSARPEHVPCDEASRCGSLDLAGGDGLRVERVHVVVVAGSAVRDRLR